MFCKSSGRGMEQWSGWLVGIGRDVAVSGQICVRYNLRPDDGPVKGPKHVVLAINTTPHY